MAVDPKTQTILIESILGGHSPMSHFAGRDQFRASLGINPAFPASDSTGTSVVKSMASGLLRPAPFSNVTTTMEHAPMWIVSNPKVNADLRAYFIYDYAGSVYTVDSQLSNFVHLTNVRTSMSAIGNGAAYYDNYVYFAGATDIARYGPLNGSPTLTDAYWTSTLGKAALTSTDYPVDNAVTLLRYPNHVMHRHSDGRLYFADVVDNKGPIHYVATTKTTVEGDTDNGSTFNALQFGYGLWPTALESYGSDLVIALFEGSSSGLRIREENAKIAFWDTTSQNFNKIVWVEFPDPIITALKNVNGVLYVVSGPKASPGFRVSRFIGGYSFEEVYYSEEGSSPFAGGIDGKADTILFGSYVLTPYPAPCVLSVGLQKTLLGKGLFNTMRGTFNGNAFVTAICLGNEGNSGTSEGLSKVAPFIGWSSGTAKASGGANAIDKPGTSYGTSYTSTEAPSYWWSQIYKIGQPFKITKIRIPLAQPVSANMYVTPTIFVDEGEQSYTLNPIHVDNFNGKRSAVYRPEGLTGDHNFFLELKWTGTVVCTVGLPIIIEYEYIGDN